MQRIRLTSDTSFVRNTYLVTYDVANDYRLRRVHKTMRGFGDHLQYSVFECQLTRTDLARCRHLLGAIVVVIALDHDAGEVERTVNGYRCDESASRPVRCRNCARRRSPWCTSRTAAGSTV